MKAESVFLILLFCKGVRESMLTPRLEMLCKQVLKTQLPFADIGTDHGYVGIALLKRGLVKKVIATDVKNGPLESVTQNAMKYGVLEDMDIRLGDGLSPLTMDEVGVVLIAGMGGLLITKILEDGIQKAKRAKILILQPMHAVERLREFLYANGFDIVHEELCLEDDKLYPVLCAKFDGVVREKNLWETFMGEKLFERRDPLLNLYMRKKLDTLKKILKGLQNAKTPSKKLFTELQSIERSLEDSLEKETLEP
jgi:tRNA (adenine22-N1)-methyltransferase